MLVARAQLDFVRDLIARFEREDSIMRPVVDHQSQYVAIIALLRSVGHVFEKVDCKEPERRAWSKAQWPFWRQEKIFGDFIEPARNALLKEFQGGLQLRGGAFESPAVVVDPLMPEGVGLLAAFNADAARDLQGRPVLPQLHAAVAFLGSLLKSGRGRL